jgi:hypothetical protein
VAFIRLEMVTTMRVLVCGGRDFADQLLVYSTLDATHADSPISCLIEGGAPGADHFGMTWAWNNNVPRERYDADWKAHGRAAGPIRNQRMIDEGKPDLVIAFPGGRGTADMVKRAEAAGIEVRRVMSDLPSYTGGMK